MPKQYSVKRTKLDEDPSRLQTIPQSHSNQNNVVLARKQTWINGTEINPHTQGQLVFHKGNKNVQWGKDSFFSKWCSRVNR